MGKNLSTTTAPAVRVVYYPEPALNASVVYTPQQLTAQRQERALRYQQWLIRRAAIEERDRRTRRAIIRIGVIVLAVVFLAVAYGCWLVYQLLNGVQLGGAGDLLVGLFVVIVALGIGGGCGCITIVRHYH